MGREIDRFARWTTEWGGNIIGTDPRAMQSSGSSQTRTALDQATEVGRITADLFDGAVLRGCKF